MEEGEHLGRGNSSPANRRRGSQDMDEAEELRDQDPPNAGGCLSSCRHCFCFLCIQEWARRGAVCPRCQQFVNHIFPMRDGYIHEDHEEGMGRPLHRRSHRSRRCPHGRRDGSSSSRARVRCRGSGRRSRYRRWHRNNRRWSRRSWNRRRLRSMDWGMEHNVGRDLPPERSIPGSSRGRSRQHSGRRRRRHRLHRHRGQRSRGWYEQPALHPSLDALFPPSRGWGQQQRGSSRSRRRSRHGQHSRGRRNTV